MQREAEITRYESYAASVSIMTMLGSHINCLRFYLKLAFGDIPQKTLVMAVYDFDRFSKHDQIGQVVIPLSSIDLCESIEDTRDLTSADDEKVRGESVS